MDENTDKNFSLGQHKVKYYKQVHFLLFEASFYNARDALNGNLPHTISEAG